MFARFYSEFFEISRIFIANFISFRTFLYRKSADGVCFRIGMTIFAGRRAEFLFKGVDEISYAFNARSVATFFERTGRRHEKVCGIVETKRQDVFCKRFAEFRFEYPVYDLPLLPMLFKKEAYRRDNYPRVE